MINITTVMVSQNHYNETERGGSFISRMIRHAFLWVPLFSIFTQYTNIYYIVWNTL